MRVHTRRRPNSWVLLPLTLGVAAAQHPLQEWARQANKDIAEQNVPIRAGRVQDGLHWRTDSSLFYGSLSDCMNLCGLDPRCAAVVDHRERDPKWCAFKSWPSSTLTVLGATDVYLDVSRTTATSAATTNMTGAPYVAFLQSESTLGARRLQTSKCDSYQDEDACSAASGCQDCPCRWRDMERAGWCRTCGAECNPPDNSEGFDAANTILILVLIFVAVLFGCAIAFCILRVRRQTARKDKPLAAPAATVGASTTSSPTPAPVARPVSSSSGASPSVVPTLVAALPKPIQPPNTWSSRGSPPKIVPVPNLIDEMQRLMTQTWKVKYTRDRKLVGGSSQVPSGCRVLNVMRVEYLDAWEKYCTHKAAVQSRRPHGCNPFIVETSSQRLTELDSNINEVYLFHGTSPSAAAGIAKSDFKIRFAGSSAGTMFGPGIYLAENSSKSDEYAKEEKDSAFAGQCAMLICRAIAGEVCVVEQPGDYASQVESGEFDSICGDRAKAVGTFREMIFFSEAAVYTEYIVNYIRTDATE